MLRGASYHFGELLTSLKKYHAIWGGCRSDSMAISRYGATKLRDGRDILEKMGLERCERVLHFKGDKTSQIQVVVAKLQGEKNCFFFFLQENKWSRSYRVTNQHPNLPWHFMTHGFLDPSTFS